MKKGILIFTISLAFAASANAQLYSSKGGASTTVSFYSHTALEDISATNNGAAAFILNTKTNDVIASVDINGFVFTNSLMQEHFNENYMETDLAVKDANGKATYPNRKASFKGKINETIDYTKDGVYPITMTGTLTMHNVAKPRTINGTLTIKSGVISVDCKFNVMCADHNIQIPEAVGQKIAESIEVTVHSDMVEPAKKK